MLALTWVVGITIGITAFIRLTFSFVEVSGTSMAPKLQPSDVVVAFRFWPSIWLRQGMTIVFLYPMSGEEEWNPTLSDNWVSEKSELKSPLTHSVDYLSTWRIKKVAAVTGEPLPPRTWEPAGDYNRTPREAGTVNSGLVPPGHLFAIGLSADSIDSRHWGPVRLQRFTRLVLFKLPKRRDETSG